MRRVGKFIATQVFIEACTIVGRVIGVWIDNIETAIRISPGLKHRNRYDTI